MATAPAGNGHVDAKLDEILNLVMACSRGEVGNDAVESALSSIVSEHAPSTSTASASVVEPPPITTNTTSTSSAPPCTEALEPRSIYGDRPIIPDDGNYDDDDEDESGDTKRARNKPTPHLDNATAAKRKKAARKTAAERQRALEQIPLGRMGERMLITFGDGPVPDFEVISAALQGTRTTLQRAILDARALRRKQKNDWHQARAEATMHRGEAASKLEMKKTSTGIQSSVADCELSFRAMEARGDLLRFDVSCGFDTTQFEVLFPEEMSAYQRWKNMHDAYSEKSVEIPKSINEEEEEADKLSAETAADPVQLETIHSGRVIERLSNFDARTDDMRSDDYLKFADIRRGSFLPRSGGTKGIAVAERKRGRPSKNRTTWTNLNPSSIVFLHWIGFDPTSALSPPNEETTQALGYLAYDFFGRIVEKAVSIRLKRDERMLNHPLLQLSGGDQLDKGNIEQALAAVEFNSLHSSSNVELGKSSKITQLYFGPGFESRLELEMDEIFGSKEKSLSAEELKARKDEENLFSYLPELPTVIVKENTESSTSSIKRMRAE